MLVAWQRQVGLDGLLPAAHQEKSLHAMASLPLGSLWHMAEMWQLHEGPACKVQDAFTSCQGLQLCCHTIDPIQVGWTVLR